MTEDLIRQGVKADKIRQSLINKTGVKPNKIIQHT